MSRRWRNPGALGLAGLAALIVGAAGPAAGAAASPAFHAGANVLVSNDELLRAAGAKGVIDQAEADLAADPANPGHLLGGAQEGRVPSGAALANGFYVSSDGGASWSAGLVPGISTIAGGAYQRVSDPVVAIGGGGSAYYASLALDFDPNDQPTQSAFLLSRSADGGRSWAPPVTVTSASGSTLIDKEWVAVDDGAASPRRGTVYAAWTRDRLVQPPTARILLSRSSDGGATWSAPSVPSGSKRLAAGPIPLVLPDGSLAVVYQAYFLSSPLNRVEVVRSSDGGATWSAPVIVASYLPAKVPGVRSGFGFNAAVDSVTGALYVTWDRRGRRRRGIVRDPADLFVARSANGGASWSSGVRISDQGRNTAQFTPTLAAAAGTVHLHFYEASPRHPHHLRVLDAESRNGARSFPVRTIVSPIFDIGHAAISEGQGRFVGDYQGLVATPSDAEALWVDSRNPLAMTGAAGGADVFSARIPDR